MKKEKIEMCKPFRPYVCPKCGQQTLFFITEDNNLIDYKQLMDSNLCIAEIRDYIKDKRVKYLKCIKCNKMFIMDWTKLYAKPLTDKKCLNQFGIN